MNDSGTVSSCHRCRNATRADRLEDAAISAWDELLLAWPRPHLLQTDGWGRVQESAGWRAHRLEVTAPGHELALPLLVLETRRPTPAVRLGLTRLYVPRGPACAAGDRAAWEAALEALAAIAVGSGAASVTVEPPGSADDAAEVRARVGAWDYSPVATMQPAHTAVVDLRGGYEAVLARMRPKGRYNVRLAVRRGVEAARLADPAAAATTLAALCAATAARQHIHQPDAAHIRAVLDAVPGAAVHVVSVADEPVAGALVAAFAGEAVYLYGGSTERHRDRQPSALLHAAIMKAAIGDGCHSYDLWGIPRADQPGHAWAGLRQFKLSLGAGERSSPGAWRWVRRPVAARADDLAERLRDTGRAARRAAAMRLRRTPSGRRD